MVIGAAVTTVIFDFDGTLFDLDLDVDRMRRDLGLEPTDRIGDALQQYLRDRDAAKLDVVSRHECDAVATGAFLPGAMETIERLRGRYHLAILTRNSRRAVLAALDPVPDGLLVVGREDVRALKPDPEGAQLVMRHFRARPDQCVLVGDTYHDVEAAKAAGMASTVVHNPRLAYAPAGADDYVDSLWQLDPA